MMIGQEMAGSHLLQGATVKSVKVQSELKRVLLWVRPDGWQARARRNAWASMVADSKRRQDRVLAARDLALTAKPALQARVP
jgi:hypothetical protein